MNLDIEQIVREYVNKSLHMSLATVSGEKPWVCEVHFVYDDDLNLYWRSLPNTRHSQEVAHNPHVAGNIVRQHAVYFEGTAEMLIDRAAQEAIFPLFKERVAASDVALDEAQTPEGHKFYKLTVENWYAFGKFGNDKGQKYTLPWNGGLRNK